MNKTLVIAGMHRSGTSLVARFVHDSGYHLGDDLFGATPSNPHGHYEDVAILAFHRRMLQRYWKNDVLVPTVPLLTAADRQAAQELIERRRSRPHWGWKEPRTCLFFSLWYPLLPEARFLLLYRPVEQVVGSILRRRGVRLWSRRGVQLAWRTARTWLLFNEQILAFAELNPAGTLVIGAENVVTRPGTFTHHLTALTQTPFSTADLQQTIDPSRFQRTRSPLLNLILTPYATASTYTRLQKLDPCE